MDQNLTTNRIVNRNAVKRHALKCAKQTKPRFTRVGADFLDEVEADVEALLRKIDGSSPVLYRPLESDAPFVTCNFMTKVTARLNEVIAAMIQRKVERQPSVGKTLNRTR